MHKNGHAYKYTCSSLSLYSFFAISFSQLQCAMLSFHVSFLHLFPLRFYCDAQKIFASHRKLVVIHQEYINSNTIVIILVIKKNQQQHSNKTAAKKRQRRRFAITRVLCAHIFLDLLLVKQHSRHAQHI